MIPTQINGTRKNVRRLPMFDDDYQLEKFLTENFTESLKQMIKVVVKTMVKTEMETFRGQFEEKLNEKLHFNGYYDRNMIYYWGRVDDIPVPRFRRNNQELNFNPRSLDVFDEEKQRFEKLISEMHLLGISQRKIKHLTQVCLGMPVSKDRVGHIYKEFADREEINVNSQILSDDFQYIFLDGLWEKTKGYGWDNNKTVLLCVLGVKQNGERKIVGFTLAHAED